MQISSMSTHLKTSEMEPMNGMRRYAYRIKMQYLKGRELLADPDGWTTLKQSCRQKV
jgi:hypothetical protein